MLAMVKVCALSMLAMLWVGCSSSGGGGSGGSSSSGGGSECNPACSPDSGDSSVPPDTFVNATVKSGSQGTCSIAGSSNLSWGLGSGMGASPIRVSNGGMLGNGTVGVTCSVHPVGSGFDVSLSAAYSSNQGGQLTITSPDGKGAVTTAGGSGLTVSLTTDQPAAMLSSSSCSLAYTYNGSPVPSSPPVTAGRIWGHVSCPAASAGSSTCDLEADFLFENCGE
jgi:hypothetical protein